MNKETYKKLLSHYHQWYTTNQIKWEEERKEREQSSSDIRKFTKERLMALDEDDCYNLIAPLWAMAMWGNKHFKVNQIVADNGLPLLRQQFTNLIYGTEELSKRWDTFREKVKGIGAAVMSELLTKSNPNEYLLWNSKIQTGLNNLGVEKVPKSISSVTGQKYQFLCKEGIKMVDFAKQNGYKEITDLFSLNYFIWQEAQDTENEITNEKSSEENNKKELTFIHNDVRDKIRDIGELLGFKAEVEKKIETGAVVDALWEISIGNMGRITYVFEVQTKGSTDSLILNLLRATNNSSVQGIVAVSDTEQLKKIKKEASSVNGLQNLKYWDYNDVLKVYEHLSSAYESINSLNLVPNGFMP